MTHEAAGERRLRVGLLSRAYPPHASASGIATYTCELAHGLHALGHEVHVFTASRQGLRCQGERLFAHGIMPDVLPITPGLPLADRRLRWGVAVAERVTELARRGTVLDLVESPNWECEGVALRRTRAVPIVVRLHAPLTAVAVADGLDPTSADLRTCVQLERWLIATADGITSSTAGVLATVRETMNLDSHACYARIPLGIAPAAIPVQQPTGPRRLLFVGRVERRKGIHTLLGVVPRLLRRHRDLQVDIVGNATEPPGEPTFRDRFAREYRLALWRRRCRFHGFVGDDELARFYRQCTLFVAPSLYESFGLTYLEAMRYGKPVIGSCVGGIPEVVRDGETGILVPPDDPESLHAAIERLLEGPALCRRLGDAARRAVETEFSPRAMAEHTAEFYLQVLARAEGKSRDLG